MHLSDFCPCHPCAPRSRSNRVRARHVAAGHSDGVSRAGLVAHCDSPLALIAAARSMTASARSHRWLRARYRPIAQLCQGSRKNVRAAVQRCRSSALQCAEPLVFRCRQSPSAFSASLIQAFFKIGQRRSILGNERPEKMGKLGVGAVVHQAGRLCKWHVCQRVPSS